jgi:hypothetical protein
MFYVAERPPNKFGMASLPTGAIGSPNIPPNPNQKASFVYRLARFARTLLQITPTVAPMQKAV